jgi:hypothetical protein
MEKEVKEEYLRKEMEWKKNLDNMESVMREIE